MSKSQKLLKIIGYRKCFKIRKYKNCLSFEKTQKL